MKKWSPLYALASIIVIWWLASHFDTRGILPSPYETGLYFQSHIDLITKHLLVSLFRIGVAIVATMILGIGIGLLTARNPKIDQWFSPLIYALYPVPKIAFLPLLMLFFGLGNTSKIVLVGLILFFQITLTVRDGIKQIPEGYFLTFKMFNPKAIHLYRHIILPAILPQVFTALRVSVGTSISVLFFAENYATTYGIGYFIMDSWLKLNYTAMFSGIVAISLLGTFIFTSIDVIEKHLCKWI